MNAADPTFDRAGMRRGQVTWYSYLMLGFFTYILNIQGNILPFLQSELGLSYRVVSLHFSAIAVGMIVTGLLGNRIIRRLGRTWSLRLAGAGIFVAAALLCLAPVAWVSIASCVLIGIPGGLITPIVFAVLATVHDEHRDVAYSEATALSYAFGILGPLAMSACLALSLGWRSAVLLDVVIGAAILVAFRKAAIPEPVEPAVTARRRLPMVYWAFWCMLGFVVALEFSVLFWAPAFLERVAGLSPTAAAAAAATFSIAMLLGRMAASGLVRRWDPRFLFVVALVVSACGFALYWWLDQPAVVVAGLFVLGLGIAPLFPLSFGFAIEAAGSQGPAGSARVMLAVGLSILIMPTLLGALADDVGLRLAHLVLPGLVIAALGLLIVAGRLADRTAATG